MTDKIHFPAGFRWGTATAAYQIEGAVHEDGRSDSIWDVFAHTPGKILNGDTGDIACDHYHRWKEDVALMKELGIPSYRFSLSWPRILPEGRGRVNQAGIDFYNRLVDELLTAGIHPMVTLYHWDIPAAFNGGWLNQESVDAFCELAHVATNALGDRVKDWVTINEPFCASILGYKAGVHAPGLREPYKALLAAHHLLLAHGEAVPVIRANCAQARVGIAPNLTPHHPESNSPEDAAAARFTDSVQNRWFLDAIFGRGYPRDMVEDYIRLGNLPPEGLNFVRAGDMEKIAGTTDFLAFNYYTRNRVKAGPGIHSNPADVMYLEAPADNRTAMGWEVYPQGLTEVLVRLHREYGPKEIVISENGASYLDPAEKNGVFRDEKRIAYLASHFAAMHDAIQQGVPLTGYYQWSLMDNFEWSLGYSQRFGMVHVDFASLKRTPRESAYWYQQVIRENGLDLAPFQTAR